MSDVRPCPACGSTQEPERLVLAEMMFGLDETFPYACCAGCASVYIEQVPEDLGDYYTKKYYSLDFDPQTVIGRPGVAQAVRLLGRSALLGRDVLAGTARRAVPLRQVRITLARFESVRVAGLSRGAQSRVLDIGSGTGALVYALSLAGLAEVTGIDPFNEADRVFDTGARVLRRSLEEVEGEYDLVMLHHSLEHVPQPRETLAQVRRLLAPGGRALVRMPTVSSAAYERYGTSWTQLDPPRHLTIFSRLGMERLCADVDLLIRTVRDDSSGVQFWASEQTKAGVPLVAETSHYINPKRSAFSAAQLRAWDKQSAQLNQQGRGDQAMWVLTAG
jgi:SAM-dependent methyltransferase